MYSHFDVIKHMILKPVLHSRIGKWELALTKYSLTYAALKAMKGKIIVDFIIDHLVTKMAQNYIEFPRWKLYFDCSTYFKGTGVWIFVNYLERIPTKYIFKTNGCCSNNKDEYGALITGLTILLVLGETKIEIKYHSKLVIKLVTKEYKCIKENLLMYFVKANSLLERFDKVDITHVLGLKNQEANDLVLMASRYKVSKGN